MFKEHINMTTRRVLDTPVLRVNKTDIKDKDGG